jgi:RNA polymerase sigma-70 factor (ECF subfamily)
MADAQGRGPLVRIDHATLVSAVAKGEGTQAARREACRKILAQVYRVVAAVLGPRSAEVADATQDAFMRVYKKIDAFSYDPEKPAGPTAWINKIALHTALDHRAGLPPWEQMGSGFPDPIHEDDHEIADTIDRSKLAAALLDQLDERHRAILILYYWNDETQEEIASTLAIPIGTVKTRMRAAHHKIKSYVLRTQDHGSGNGGADKETVEA